ncbi:TPR domain protein [Minicystis rosea]|nr:TPR domain protein [Minicystis rosea]
MRRLFVSGVIALAWMNVGCGREALTAPVTPEVKHELPQAARTSFEDGLRKMADHDRARDWNEAACKETMDLLMAAAQVKPAAMYDAALVKQRCGKDEEAKVLLRRAVEQDPSFHAARAALALREAAEPGQLDHAIAELRRAVIDGRFTSVDVQVALAVLLMKRDDGKPDEDGADDLDRAKKNLHRALAIDDGHMPALNQLAILHLTRAKRDPGRTGPSRKAAVSGLELAALVCSQAMRKNPRYAPIHNTAGLVDVELGNLSRAAAAFDEARRLDPRFVEAHLNYAAVNLGFRGFAQAEGAYRQVLAIRPDDYDARLGLALAIRGQLEGPHQTARIEEARKEIAEAKRLAPTRPEAYFNEAILTQAYADPANASYQRARELYKQFIDKAGDAPAYAEAKRQAQERISEITQAMDFLTAPKAQ